jgi:hypothetical protein
MPPAGSGPSPSPLCLQATCGNKTFPTKVRPIKWGRQNNAIAETNNKRFVSQTSKCFKQQMFITWPLGQNSNKKHKGHNTPNDFQA